MLSKKGRDIDRGQDGITQLLIHITCLRFYFSLCASFIAALVLLLLLLLQLLNHSYLKPWIFLLPPFQFTSFILLQQRSQECLCGAYCWLRLNHDTAISDSSFFFSLSFNNPTTCIGTSLCAAIDLLIIPCACQTYLLNLFSKHKLFWGFFPCEHQSEYTEKKPKTFLSFWSSTC